MREALAKQPQVLLYLYGALAFMNPVQISRFVECAKQAWLMLRWLHPEVCLEPYLPGVHDTVGHGDDIGGIRKMCCSIPSNLEEATEWADASLSFDFARDPESGTSGNAIKGLRGRVADLRGERVPPVVLRFAARLKDKGEQEKMLGEIQYAFCVDHACTDGVGVYMVAGKYLALLAEQLSDSISKELDWAKCVDNLPMPWIGVMNSEQRTDGAGFAKNVNLLQEKIDEYIVCARRHSLLWYCLHSY